MPKEEQQPDVTVTERTLHLAESGITLQLKIISDDTRQFDLKDDELKERENYLENGPQMIEKPIEVPSDIDLNRPLDEVIAELTKDKETKPKQST